MHLIVSRKNRKSSEDLAVGETVKSTSPGWHIWANPDDFSETGREWWQYRTTSESETIVTGGVS